MALTTLHLLMKGEDMAVSKNNRATRWETNPFFLELFREHGESDDRERHWHAAMAHAGEGDPPLRFPAYECLYRINVCAQKLVDLLDEASIRFGVEREALAYYHSLIQSVRAGASQDIISFMNGVELTEAWLFEQLRRSEETRLRDPEDVYLEVKRLESERAEKGLPPRLEFIEDRKTSKSRH
jgi:hypothetical protein